MSSVQDQLAEALRAIVDADDKAIAELTEAGYGPYPQTLELTDRARAALTRYEAASKGEGGDVEWLRRATPVYSGIDTKAERDAERVRAIADRLELLEAENAAALAILERVRFSSNPQEIATANCEASNRLRALARPTPASGSEQKG